MFRIERADREQRAALALATQAQERFGRVLTGCVRSGLKAVFGTERVVWCSVAEWGNWVGRRSRPFCPGVLDPFCAARFLLDGCQPSRESFYIEPVFARFAPIGAGV